MLSLLWPGVALLALLGWAFTLVAFTRSLLPQASVLSVLQRVDALMDERVTSTIQRIRDREGKLGKPPTVPPLGMTSGPRGVFDELFGQKESGFGEQPYPEGVEVEA